MSKTIDFLENIKSIKLTSPLDKETIIDLLESFPNDDIWGLVDHCLKLMNDYQLIRDVLSSVPDRERCESVVYGLNEEQVISLSHVVIGMKDAIELDDFKRIKKALINVTEPTDESIKRAKLLFDTIEKRRENINLNLAGDLFLISKHLHHLGRIFLNFDRNTEEEWITDLSRLSEEDLHSLIFIGNNLLKYGELVFKIEDKIEKK